MTIDTARCEHGNWRLPECRVCFPPECEACNGTGLACTEPAPSAGNLTQNQLEFHILTLEATPQRARSIWQNEQLQFYRELLFARSRIAELSRQLEQAEAVRSDEAFGGALSDELYKKRIAELEAGIRKWASECAECDGKGFIRAVVTIHRDGHVDRPCEACADIRAILPKESDNG